MNDLQKMGGVAALIMAATWLVGFAVFLGVLTPAGYFDADVEAAQKVAILADHQTLASLSYLLPYVIWGLFQVVLALALYARLKAGAPALAQTATAIGLILAGVGMASGMIGIVGIGRVVELYGTDPVQAGTVWLVIESVILGLTENEIVSGSWVLLISWAAIRAGELPRALNYLGVVLGVAGMLTVVPILEVLGAVEVLGLVFGLGLIVWFVWLGLVMWRSRPSAAA